MEVIKFGEFTQLLASLFGGLNVLNVIGVERQDHLSCGRLKCGIGEEIVKDKVMKLAFALCETSTVDEIIELCGYLKAYADARVKEQGTELHEELI